MKIDLTVLYLIRLKDEQYEKKFKDFFLSYLRHQSGVQHNLLVVFKGFNKKNLMDKLNFLKKKNIKFKYAQVKDENDFDLGTYKKISKIVDTKYIFFLNSSSKILCLSLSLISSSIFQSVLLIVFRSAKRRLAFASTLKLFS